MAKLHDLLLSALVVGAVAVPGIGFSGGQPLGSPDVGEKPMMTPAMSMALHQPTGGTPVAVDLMYRVPPMDGGPGPLLAVYAHLPDATGKPSPERVLLGHVVAFSPPGPDGLNAATVQVPPDLAEAFAAGDLLIELEHAAEGDDVRALLAASSPVTLESAVVVSVD